MNTCHDCGAPTSGLRCRRHAEQALARYWAFRLAERDEHLLGQWALGISLSSLAAERGVSRVRISQLVKDALRRQVIRDYSKERIA